ncbi:sugar transferase [Pelagibacterium xiamenense]|uniref:sugar transferase n=1 Tax=Pelagibacterium xiamenense TaxID=2901140 RepID=UPI001E3CD5DF|nr:sugar transferase [Pelagibacterium xiamenense]MCD7061413.1 sugar transferase [Pelagibacterium xiamenense]
MSTPERKSTEASPARPLPNRHRPARNGASRRRGPEVYRLDLLNVVERGASVRRHRFLTDLRRLLVPAAVSGAVQCAIYASFILRANRSDWHNLAIVCAVLFVMPFVVAGVLAMLRRKDFPFTASAFITLIVYNFGVVALSALRVPVSYTGLLWAAPFAIVGMVLAAARLRRAHHERIAILDFPGVKDACALLGGKITVIKDKATDIADFDRILIDGATHHSAEWTAFLTRAYMRGAEVSPWISVLEQKQGRVNIDHFDLTHLAYSPSQIYYAKAKRLLDLLLIVVTLPIVAPVGALVWLYIRLVDGGPSLFIQTRRGYGGRNFRMLKFRTMRKGTHGGATGSEDKRILPGCRFLRRFRIDELPQLINIWRGEMSWIGPRPVSLEIARECERLTAVYTNRYLVLPGITGWAQVTYGYAGSSQEELEKLGYDLYYLKNISLDLDLEITLRTIQTLLTRKGAR